MNSNEIELEGAARELGGMAQEGLGTILGTPEDQIAGRIKQATGQAQQVYADATKEVSEYVQTKPLTALMISMGVGVLLGALLVSR